MQYKMEFIWNLYYMPLHIEMVASKSERNSSLLFRILRFEIRTTTEK